MIPTVRVHAKATPRATIKTTMTKGGSAFLPSWMNRDHGQGPEVKKKDTDLINLDTTVDVLLKRAVVEVTAEKNDQMIFKLSDLDFSMELPWHLPRSVMNIITERIKGRIGSDLPTIDIQKIMKERGLADLPIVPNLHLRRISGEGSEILMSIDVDFDGSPRTTMTVPRYVGDKRPNVMEVHRVDCPSAYRMDEKDKVGYSSLYDAISDGLRPAKDCLVDAEVTMASKGPVQIPTVDIKVPPPTEVITIGGPRHTIPVKGPEDEEL